MSLFSFQVKEARDGLTVVLHFEEDENTMLRPKLILGHAFVFIRIGSKVIVRAMPLNLRFYASLNEDQKFSRSISINNSAFYVTSIGLPTMMDAQALEKRLISHLSDGEVRRIISLKAVGFSIMEISRMLSRNESTIRSFLKKWNSQGVFRGQVGAALALNPEQVRLTRHRNHFHFYDSVSVTLISPLVKTQRL
jgi:hypothetical protein